MTAYIAPVTATRVTLEYGGDTHTELTPDERLLYAGKITYRELVRRTGQLEKVT